MDEDMGNAVQYQGSVLYTGIQGSRLIMGLDTSRSRNRSVARSVNTVFYCHTVPVFSIFYKGGGFFLALPYSLVCTRIMHHVGNPTPQLSTCDQTARNKEGDSDQALRELLRPDYGVSHQPACGSP